MRTARDSQWMLLSHEEPDPEGSTANQKLGCVKRNLRGAPLCFKITATLLSSGQVWNMRCQSGTQISARTLTLWKRSSARQHDGWNHNIPTMSASPVFRMSWNGHQWWTVDVSPSCTSYIRYTQVQWIWTLRETLILIILLALLTLDLGLTPMDIVCSTSLMASLIRSVGGLSKCFYQWLCLADLNADVIGQSINKHGIA